MTTDGSDSGGSRAALPSPHDPLARMADAAAIDAAGAAATAPGPLVTCPKQLAALPVTIPLYAPDESVCGTFFLHDYVQCSNPARPPPCVLLLQERGSGGAGMRVTPRVAEARAGREARKNWKESFRTVLDGRLVSLKAFFALHDL
eukprot:351651-Chlamydomonas_euryale.AAC.1